MFPPLLSQCSPSQSYLRQNCTLLPTGRLAITSLKLNLSVLPLELPFTYWHLVSVPVLQSFTVHFTVTDLWKEMFKTLTTPKIADGPSMKAFSRQIFLSIRVWKKCDSPPGCLNIGTMEVVDTAGVELGRKNCLEIGEPTS